jgi:hypothetical protein
MVRPLRLERRTYGLKDRYSNQLSYERKKPTALPTELRTHYTLKLIKSKINLVGEEGFEPTQPMATDLQSALALQL